jgi:hypothetical protein
MRKKRQGPFLCLTDAGSLVDAAAAEAAGAPLRLVQFLYFFKYG